MRQRVAAAIRFIRLHRFWLLLPLVICSILLVAVLVLGASNSLPYLYTLT